MPIRVIDAGEPTPSAALPFNLPQPPVDREQRPAGVSLCMIVKNEERFLAECLRSVEGAVDEICIVDTGSTDRTVEIAQSFGARVEHRDWRNDFAWARNASLEMARFRWILVLDADEELTFESRTTLRSMRAVPGANVGLWVRCLNQVDEHGGGTMSHALPRFFPNAPFLRYRSPVHEFVADERTGEAMECRLAPLTIIHKGYRDAVIESRSKMERNLGIIEAAIESDPTNAFHWYNLGTTRLAQGNVDASIEAFAKMVVYNGDLPRGFIPAGLCLYADVLSRRKGDHAGAHEILDRCLRISPKFANAFFVRGQTFVREGEYDASREAFEGAIACAGSSMVQMIVDEEIARWKAHSEIAVGYIEQGDREKAVEWFTKGIANAPEATTLRRNRARTLEDLGRFAEAEDDLEYLYRRAFSDQAAVDYVNFLLRRSRFTPVLEIIRESAPRTSTEVAVNLYLTAASIVNRLGLSGADAWVALAVERDPGSGVAYATVEAMNAAQGSGVLQALLDRELDGEPSDPLGFARRSHLLLEKNDAAGALRYAEQGLAQAPRQAMLLFNAAMASVRLERVDDAIAYLEQLTRDNAEIYATGTYLRAVLHARAERYAESSRALDALADAATENIDALLLRADVEEKQANLRAAETALVRAAAIDMRGARALATFYLRAGRYAEAAAAADRALATV